MHRSEIRIRVNGVDEVVAPDLSLERYLEEKDFDRRYLVVEHNGEALARDQFSSVVLQDGDRLELVRPVAGG